MPIAALRHLPVVLTTQQLSRETYHHTSSLEWSAVQGSGEAPARQLPQLVWCYQWWMCSPWSTVSGLVCFWGKGTDLGCTCSAALHVCIPGDMNTKLPYLIYMHLALLVAISRSGRSLNSVKFYSISSPASSFLMEDQRTGDVRMSIRCQKKRKNILLPSLFLLLSPKRKKRNCRWVALLLGSGRVSV